MATLLEFLHSTSTQIILVILFATQTEIVLVSSGLFLFPHYNSIQHDF
jgi:hypothetical protein